MTPKFKGLGDAVRRLVNEIDADSEKLLGSIESLHERRTTVFAKVNERVANTAADLAAVDGFLDDLDKSNGAPSDIPLPQQDGSPESSKAWLGK